MGRSKDSTSFRFEGKLLGVVSCGGHDLVSHPESLWLPVESGWKPVMGGDGQTRWDGGPVWEDSSRCGGKYQF